MTFNICPVSQPVCKPSSSPKQLCDVSTAAVMSQTRKSFWAVGWNALSYSTPTQPFLSFYTTHSGAVASWCSVVVRAGWPRSRNSAFMFKMSATHTACSSSIPASGSWHLLTADANRRRQWWWFREWELLVLSETWLEFPAPSFIWALSGSFWYFENESAHWRALYFFLYLLPHPIPAHTQPRQRPRSCI